MLITSRPADDCRLLLLLPLTDATVAAAAGTKQSPAGGGAAWLSWMRTAQSGLGKSMTWQMQQSATVDDQPAAVDPWTVSVEARSVDSVRQTADRWIGGHSITL